MKKIYTKILLVIITLFAFTTTCFAIDKDAYIKEARTEENNYGITKDVDYYIEGIELIPYVDENLKIYDFSNILSDEEEENLKKISEDFKIKNNAEIIILTGDNEFVTNIERNQFVRDFYNYNDFAKDIRYYSGIIIFRNNTSTGATYEAIAFGESQYYSNFDLDEIEQSIESDYFEGFKKFIETFDDLYDKGIPESMRDYKLTDKGIFYDSSKYEVNQYGNLVYKESEANSYLKYIKEERTKENNYGINKKWNVSSSNTAGIPYVDESYKIYDFSDVLTDEEELILKEYSDKFREKYQTELIIVTYNLPYSYDEDNEDFAADFYDYNDFGLDTQYYDGIVLFRNTYESDPYYDMYTFGQAQLYFDQSKYDYILDNIYDELHGEEYLSGFTKFISLTNTAYQNGIPSSMKDYKLSPMGIIYDSTKYKLDDKGNIVKKYIPPILPALIIALCVSGGTVGIMILKNRMVKKSNEAAIYLNKNSVDYTIMRDIYRGRHISSYTIQNSSSGSSGVGHSGSSGGGHSSGGGRHG